MPCTVSPDVYPKSPGIHEHVKYLQIHMFNRKLDYQNRLKITGMDEATLIVQPCYSDDRWEVNHSNVFDYFRVGAS